MCGEYPEEVESNHKCLRRTAPFSYLKFYAVSTRVVTVTPLDTAPPDIFFTLDFLENEGACDTDSCIVSNLSLRSIYRPVVLAVRALASRENLFEK